MNSEDRRHQIAYRQRNDKFTLDSYKWSGVDYDSSMNVQSIIFKEFQPELSLNAGKLIKNGIDTLISGAKLPLEVLFGKTKLDSNGVAQPGSVGGRAISNIAGAAATYGIFKAMDRVPDKTKSGLDDIGNNIYKKLFSGTVLREFHFPYLNDTYLQSSKGTWSNENLGSSVGGIEMSNQMLGLNIPSIPSWTNDDQTVEQSLEFYLLNDTVKDLLDNFKMVHTLLPGTLWMQNGLVQRSPNIYQVYIPGRTMCYFASLDVTIECVGKLRVVPLAGKTINSTFKGINESTLFPDAYKVTIKWKNITPNNFNAYEAFMNNVSSKVTVNTGEQQDAFNSGGNIVDAVSEVFSSKEQDEDARKKSYDTINSQLNSYINKYRSKE
jgi:hypothetical protein